MAKLFHKLEELWSDIYIYVYIHIYIYICVRCYQPRLLTYIIAEDLNIKTFGRVLDDLRSMRSDCVHGFFNTTIKWYETIGLFIYSL
jgi:hypothetical protein